MRCLGVAYWVLFLLILMCSERVECEWKVGERIYIGNRDLTAVSIRDCDFSEKTERLYVGGFNRKGWIYECDTNTMVNVGKLQLDNEFSAHKIIVDSSNNKIFSVDNSGDITAFHLMTRKKINKYNSRPLQINPLCFFIGKNNDRIYYVNSISIDNDDPETLQYIICIDSESMKEQIRIEIPKKKQNSVFTNHFFEEPYRCLFVDQDKEKIYIGFQTPSQGEQDDNFYKTHSDSVYVLDMISEKIVKTIPVGAAPRHIIKNPNTGDIFINCIGQHIDQNSGYNTRNPRALLSVISGENSEIIKNIDVPLNMISLESAISVENNLLYFGGNIISGDSHEIIGKLEDKYFWVAMDTIYDGKNEEIIVVGLDNYIYIYDAITGVYKRGMMTGIQPVNSDISEEKNKLYFTLRTPDIKFCTVDLGENEIIKVVNPDFSTDDFIIHPVNGNAYVASNDNLIKYNPDTDSVIQEKSITILGRIMDVDLDVSLHSLFVLTCDFDDFESSFLYIFDDENLELRSKIDLNLYDPHDIVVDPKTKRVFIRENYNWSIDNGTSLLGIVDLTSESVIETYDMPFNYDRYEGTIALNTNKNILYFIQRPGSILLYSTDPFTHVDTVDFDNSLVGWIRYITFNAKSSELFISGDSGVVVLDTNTNLITTLHQDLYSESSVPLLNSITGKYYYISTHGTAAIQEYVNVDIGIEPPPQTANLMASVANAITITWPAVDHSDVQGYKVYRSPSDADQWTKLNTELVTYTSFLDETAVPNTPYDYLVRTTGLYNISSDPSESVTATRIIDPGFSLSSILSSQSTEKGATIEYIITSESIEQFATLIDLAVEGLPDGLTATFASEQLRPGEVTSLTVDIADDFDPDNYEFEVIGIADGIEHRVPLTLTVVETEQEESAITLSLSSKLIEFGDAMFATGRIIPAVITPVSLVFMSSSETKTVSTASLSDGTFSIDFEPETSGEWTVEASWAGNDNYSGADSELKVFDALSGQTKITCTTDVSADAEVGWQMTVKGTVFPNPGVGDVVLYVTKPDGTKEKIDGLKINELGYYGYNITADQPGFWEVTAGWAGNSRYLGSVSETLIVPYGLDIGRAIIVVSPKQNKPFYYTANRLGNLAYQTFSKRRFDNPRIKYFDIDTTQDLNGDGFTGDVDGEPTLENVTDAISTWAAAAVNEETPLCIYLIGEGSLDGIELSDSNLLTASYLADLLSGVETTTGCDDVIVVVDAPHSGKFVSELSKLGRCVVTSTNLGKSNYIGNGKLSFSQYFLNYAYQGKSLRDSFLYTKRVLSNLPGAFKKQEPQVEGEGNLFANESSDFLKTANWYFGSSYGLQDLMPRVKSMSLASVTGQSGGVGKIVTNTHDVLSDERTPSLKLAKSVAAQGVDVWVRVDDAESNISSVFATVFSPQDSVLQEVELYDPDSDGKYEGVVYGLDDIGAYDIVAYAFDESENVSEPMKSLVMVVEREVVLEPPTDVRVDDMPEDNGYHVRVAWSSSPSEENGDVGWYRIYRSRKDELTSPIPLSQFTNLDTLNVYEENYTILVDSVAVGQADYVDSVPLNSVNYYYWIDATGATGASKKVAAETPTFVEVIPEGFVVHQPYPNPFNPSTTIRYELPVESHVEFVVYDVLGRKVKVLEDRIQEAGNYDVVWDGVDGEGLGVGSGMYFYQVKAGEVVKKGKMVLVR